MCAYFAADLTVGKVKAQSEFPCQSRLSAVQYLAAPRVALGVIAGTTQIGLLSIDDCTACPLLPNITRLLTLPSLTACHSGHDRREGKPHGRQGVRLCGPLRDRPRALDVLLSGTRVTVAPLHSALQVLHPNGRRVHEAPRAALLDALFHDCPAQPRPHA